MNQDGKMELAEDLWHRRWDGGAELFISMIDFRRGWYETVEAAVAALLVPEGHHLVTFEGHADPFSRRIIIDHLVFAPEHTEEL